MKTAVPYRVIRAVHRLQAGHLVQHGGLGLPPVVVHQFAGNTKPDSVMECADLCLRIHRQLFGNGFPFPRLDIQLPFKNQGGAEGPHAGLVPLHRRQIIGLGLLQKLAYTLEIGHDKSPF